VTQTEARLSAAAFEALFAQCSNWGRWGEDDQRGTLNLITPEKTRAAAALVQEGVSVSCALPINTTADLDNPMPGTHLMLRAGDVTPDWPTHSTADYLAIAPHGLAHSHLDALCHVTWQGQIYNGRPASQVTSMGALCNDITAGAQGIVSRGVLLDLPAVRGVEWLEPNTALRPSDLEAAEAAAGVRVESGDLLLVRTGRWKRRAAHGAWNPWQEASPRCGWRRAPPAWSTRSRCSERPCRWAPLFRKAGARGRRSACSAGGGEHAVPFPADTAG
jgi:hypothetical protein